MVTVATNVLSLLKMPYPIETPYKLMLIFQLILVTDGWDISFEMILLWMSLYLTDKSTLVQVMA